MREDSPTEPRPATQEEIEEAIWALTPAQLGQLKKSSRSRHRSLGPRGAGRNEDDLLCDAITAVLEGRRKWVKKNCNFVALLQGVMRSLASHIRDGKAIDAFDEIDPNPENEQDTADDFLEQTPTHEHGDPEQLLLARDLDKQISERFADDVVVVLIYESLQVKMKPATIRLALDITENEYHAAVKRLRRAVRGFVEGRSL